MGRSAVRLALVPILSILGCAAQPGTAEEGWYRLRQGDLEDAARQFTAARAAHRNDPNPLWGLALVEYERAKQAGRAHPAPTELERLDRAVALIEHAEGLASPQPPAAMLNDHGMLLATRGGLRTHLGSARDAAHDFDRAEDLFRRAEAIEAHPLIYENSAALETYRGRPDAARVYAEKARRLRTTSPATPPPG
jgi:tetratricopeptide (TPR) repeat protein